MKYPSAALWLLPALAGCASTSPRNIASTAAAIPVEVQILAFNDFHGNLEPPKLSIAARVTGGTEAPVPAGGISYLAGALAALRQGQRHSITVSAGDLIGASPLTSALFLDEPTIIAMNRLGLGLNAVGNHEFDRGSAELVRMQQGGCARHASREPCAVDRPFPGASFRFLAANVIQRDGAPLFPGSAIRDFGPVRIGFIGMTLRQTGTLVTPSGVAGLTFADEAASANALVPGLKAQGADTIVLLIHQGGRTEGGHDDPACPGLAGDILPILDRLDPAIEVVVSGHTHAAYRCELPSPNGGPVRLLTSAGRYGTMLTDIRLTFDAAGDTLLAKRATQTIVQGEGFSTADRAVPLTSAAPRFAADPQVAAIVERYAKAARPLANRMVAKFSRAVSAMPDEHGGRRLGEMIADAQLAWTRPGARGKAEIALMNPGGVRADLVPGPGGSVTYGQLFALQPFGNGLVVQTMTGAQLRRLLEQQFGAGEPRLLLPSSGFAYSYDPRRPAGERIVKMTLGGRPVDPERRYRVTVNSFLASGGDGFTVLTEGTDRIDAGLDLDALEAYLRAAPKIPAGGRIRNLAAAAD